MSIEAGPTGSSLGIGATASIGAPSGIEGGISMANTGIQTGTSVATEQSVGVATTPSPSMTVEGSISIESALSPTISLDTAAPSDQSLNSIFSQTSEIQVSGVKSLERSFDLSTALSMPALYQRSENSSAVAVSDIESLGEVATLHPAEEIQAMFEQDQPDTSPSFEKSLTISDAREAFRDAIVDQVENSMVDYLESAVTPDAVDQTESDLAIQPLVNESMARLATESAEISQRLATVADPVISELDTDLVMQEMEADEAQVVKVAKAAMAAGISESDAVGLSTRSWGERSRTKQMMSHLQSASRGSEIVPEEEQEQEHKPLPVGTTAKLAGIDEETVAQAEPLTASQRIDNPDAATQTVDESVQEDDVLNNTENMQENAAKLEEEVIPPPQHEVVDEDANANKIATVVQIAEEEFVKNESEDGLTISGADIAPVVIYELNKQDPQEKSEIVGNVQPDFSLPEYAEAVGNLPEMGSVEEVEQAAKDLAGEIPSVRVGSGKGVTPEDTLRVLYPASGRQVLDKAA